MNESFCGFQANLHNLKLHLSFGNKMSPAAVSLAPHTLHFLNLEPCKCCLHCWLVFSFLLSTVYRLWWFWENPVFLGSNRRHLTPSCSISSMQNWFNSNAVFSKLSSKYLIQKSPIKNFALKKFQYTDRSKLNKEHNKN
jgi:hypothetical protein